MTKRDKEALAIAREIFSSNIIKSDTASDELVAYCRAHTKTSKAAKELRDRVYYIALQEKL